jgi:hypothetical protein
MKTLNISTSYLNRENARGNNVEKWIKSYCGRNSIPVVRVVTSDFGKDDSEHLEIQFRSVHQLAAFVMRGNRTFPYFEFL